MIKILVIAHGTLGKSIIDTSKMLIGNTEDVYSINFFENDGIQILEEKIKKFIKKNYNEDIIIFTDIMGGSPFNAVSIITHNHPQIKNFYGVNLPLFIEAVIQREKMNLNELSEFLEKNKNNSLGISTL